MMIETWYNNLANLFKEITIYFRKQIVPTDFNPFQLERASWTMYAYAIYL